MLRGFRPRLWGTNLKQYAKTRYWYKKDYTGFRPRLRGTNLKPTASSLFVAVSSLAFPSPITGN